MTENDDDVAEAFARLCEALGVAATAHASLEVPVIFRAIAEKAANVKAAELAATFLSKAKECADEAKRLKMPEGSAAHLAANVWRAAVAIADPQALRDPNVAPAALAPE